jgi:cytochrome c
MYTPRWISAALVAGLMAGVVQAGDGPGLGRPISESQIAAWDIDIGPDGDGLPPGGGTPAQGAKIYAAACLVCHGEGARGGPHDSLVGGIGTLGGDTKALKTAGSFWPYAPTLFDYIRRAMPLDAPMSLSDDEVYAVVAYILNLNGLIPADSEMNALELPQVRMPNRDGFVSYYPTPVR